MLANVDGHLISRITTHLYRASGGITGGHYIFCEGGHVVETVGDGRACGASGAAGAGFQILFMGAAVGAGHVSGAYAVEGPIARVASTLTNEGLVCVCGAGCLHSGDAAVSGEAGRERISCGVVGASIGRGDDEFIIGEGGGG